MQHDVLRHSDFFLHMEEFGYLRDIEEMLPEDFTAVFEIARVLEDEHSSLARTLAPALIVSPPAPVEAGNSREWRPNRTVSHGEEYEAALMRSQNDITRIFPHQYLLPDEVFMRRLAQRTLWINLPRTPVIIPFGSNATEYSPNNFKQKVYILLDTSTSMGAHHRLQMAKAVTYVFLKRNLQELGHIYLRTFDVDLGPLCTATDEASLRRLIRNTMRISHMGNGTAMERAILQAADDIRASASLSGAEILVITDGACHLDVEKIREACGESIRINAIKIGNAEIYADEKTLRDLVHKKDNADSRTLVKMEEEVRRARFDLDHNHSEAERRRLQGHIAAIERRIAEFATHAIQRAGQYYGREIELLACVFVQVDDIEADALFILDQTEIDELRELLREVEADLNEGIDADTMREAALLYEHVQMLLRETDDPEMTRQLRELEQRLAQMLKSVMENSGTLQGALEKMGRNDLRDLQMMLRMKGDGTSIIRVLLALLRRAVARLRRR